MMSPETRRAKGAAQGPRSAPMIQRTLLKKAFMRVDLKVLARVERRDLKWIQELRKYCMLWFNYNCVKPSFKKANVGHKCPRKCMHVSRKEI